MKTSEAGIALIKGFESFRASPYLCPAGVPTIGYGTTIYPGGKNVRVSDSKITEAKACEYLANDLLKAERAVSAHVAVPINQGQFDALVSFAYNCGSGALIGSTLLRRLNDGDYDGAADEFGKWTHGGGVVLPGLVRRRAAERAMFEGR